METVKFFILFIFHNVNAFNSSFHYYEDKLPFVNRAGQTTLLFLILFIAILFNGAVMLNISKDALKARMVHFVLIRHVCFTDFVGAVVVLPVPMVASFLPKGTWDLSDTLCALISTTTASAWTMHLVAVAAYRADRVLAIWLPTGRYPLISVRSLNVLLTTTWTIVLILSLLATLTFGPTYQPTLQLCIPNVPLAFFITVFSCYICALIGLTTFYAFSFCRSRKKRGRVLGTHPMATQDALATDTSPSATQDSIATHPIATQDSIATHPISTTTIHLKFNEKYRLKPPPHTQRSGPMATRALTSLGISLGHLILYVPSMMVVGLLPGKSLPPGINLVVGLVVYCEFLVQPAALFALSPRLRGEVFAM